MCIKNALVTKVAAETSEVRNTQHTDWEVTMFSEDHVYPIPRFA